MMLLSINCRSLVLDFVKRLRNIDANLNTVIAPNFTCKSALEPYFVLEFNVLFYDVVDCRPDEQEIIKHMQSTPNSIVLWINYFGTNDLSENFRLKVRENNAYLHLDYAQCLPAEKIKPEKNEFLTYSLRKVNIANAAILESSILNQGQFLDFYPDTQLIPNFTKNIERKFPVYLFIKACVKLLLSFYKLEYNNKNKIKTNHIVYRIISSDGTLVRTNILKMQRQCFNQKLVTDLIQRLAKYPSARLLTHDLQHSSGICFQFPHRKRWLAILRLSIFGYEAYGWPHKDSVFFDKSKDILVVKKKNGKQ